MAKQWREIYDEWEKAVAPGLQQMAASDGFRDLMAASAKVTSAFATEFERASRRWLHFWNLPAATDIRKLRQQVASIDRELAGLKNLVFEVAAADRVPDVEPVSNGHAESATTSPATATASTPSAAAPKPELSVVEQPAAL